VVEIGSHLLVRNGRRNWIQIGQEIMRGPPGAMEAHHLSGGEVTIEGEIDSHGGRGGVWYGRVGTRSVITAARIRGALVKILDHDELLDFRVQANEGIVLSLFP
jgi:hypothetical protein